MKTPTEIAAEVVGMTEAQAVDHIDAADFTSRVASIDGEPMPLTMEMRMNRINLTIESDIVTEASIG